KLSKQCLDVFTPAESIHETMDVSTKGIPSPHSRGWDGVVLHALAFNTLLSSQETDAYTVVPAEGPGARGVSFASLCLYSFRPAFSRQIDPFGSI
ncbi:hypothetical protein, partial [Streptosporangium sp. NPDC000396]|uniref:hypothetical protein n=1 Tax=Streptosporangium sp. NPDC000396 TaxID=3366185 RepID=UPI0036CCD836